MIDDLTSFLVVLLDWQGRMCLDLLTGRGGLSGWLTDTLDDALTFIISMSWRDGLCLLETDGDGWAITSLLRMLLITDCIGHLLMIVGMNVSTLLMMM